MKIINSNSSQSVKSERRGMLERRRKREREKEEKVKGKKDCNKTSFVKLLFLHFRVQIASTSLFVEIRA